MSIYVEILVRAPMDTLWAHTQTPALHQKWDLRFSRIEYLPKPHQTAPQRFRHTTRTCKRKANKPASKRRCQ